MFTMDKKDINQDRQWHTRAGHVHGQFQMEGCHGFWLYNSRNKKTLKTFKKSHWKWIITSIPIYIWRLGWCLLLIFFLDRLSSKLPKNITRNWRSVRDVYQLYTKYLEKASTERGNLDINGWTILNFSILNTCLSITIFQ